jgi:hypothetical protein
LGTSITSAPTARNSSASGPSGGGASDTAITVWPRARCAAARSSATRSWPPTPNDDSTCAMITVLVTATRAARRKLHSAVADAPPPAEPDPLAVLGLTLATDQHDTEVRTACIRVARRLHEAGAKAIGFIPSDDRVAVPPLLVQIGNALCDLTGGTVAVVDANVRYPGLAALAQPAGGDEVFSTRWLAGSLALLTPAKVERAGRGGAGAGPGCCSMAADLFAHILCDLTGFELIGEHASAAACMDAVVLVGRAHRTDEEQLLALAALMPADRFLGVLLVG